MSRNSPTAARGSAAGKRFVLLASEFNKPITRLLVRGATDLLQRHGAASRSIRVVWVPGAFELPVVAARAARRRPRPHAIIALGALIRGETRQYEILAQAVAQGLAQVSVRERLPVTFGVIVAETLAQAKARAGLPAPRRSRGGKARQAGGSMGNRGAEAAAAALAVLRLFDTLESAR